jgi:hypothetical protein
VQISDFFACLYARAAAYFSVDFTCDAFLPNCIASARFVHYLFCNLVGFLFVHIAGLADLQLWLDADSCKIKPCTRPRPLCGVIVALLATDASNVRRAILQV